MSTRIFELRKYTIHIPGVLILAFTSIVAANARAGESGEFGALAASKEWTPPKDPLVLKKLSDWQDLKLGVLISWQPSAIWGVDSWVLMTKRMEWNRRMDWPAGKPAPFAEDDRAFQRAYDQLPLTFNPVKFDPQKWAAALKDGGVRYALAMTKHHDGFCMWDTRTTDYRITSPEYPFHADSRADTVKKISDAVRKQGLWSGLYFSKPDWNSPHYWLPELGPGAGQGPNYEPRERPAEWQKFKEFTWKQIEELVTGYGPQHILWLDGGAVQPPWGIDMDGMAAMARKHQPGMIVVDRTVRGPNENYITPENEIPDHYLPYPWETCMTISQHWNWFPRDEFKTSDTLIRNLCRIVARNGSYLIGIGPDGEGEFDPRVYERLKEIGAWLKVNGEAIYGTRPVKPYELENVVFTCKPDGTVYAIAVSAKDGDPMPRRVRVPAELVAGKEEVKLLGSEGARLKVEQAADGMAEIIVPENVAPPCAAAWTFRLPGVARPK